MAGWKRETAREWLWIGVVGEEPSVQGERQADSSEFRNVYMYVWTVLGATSGIGLEVCYKLDGRC